MPVEEKTLVLKLSPDRARQLYQALHVELDFIVAKIRHEESTSLYKSAVAALSHWRKRHSEIVFLAGMLEGAALMVDPNGDLLHYMQRGMWLEEMGIVSEPRRLPDYYREIPEPYHILPDYPWAVSQTSKPVIATAPSEPLEAPQTHAEPRNVSEAVPASADASQGTPDGKEGEVVDCWCESCADWNRSWDAYTAFPSREHDMGGEGGGA